MDVVQQTPPKCVKDRDSLAWLFQAAGKNRSANIHRHRYLQRSSGGCSQMSDSALIFSKHVSSLVRTCYFKLCQLRSIRKSLTVDTYHTLVRSFNISRLDYCNRILTGEPADLLN